MDRPAELHAALAELRALHSADPAARRANATVRLTAHTLEFFWQPTMAAERDRRDRSPGPGGW